MRMLAVTCIAMILSLSFSSEVFAQKRAIGGIILSSTRPTDQPVFLEFGVHELATACRDSLFDEWDSYVDMPVGLPGPPNTLYPFFVYECETDEEPIIWSRRVIQPYPENQTQFVQSFNLDIFTGGNNDTLRFRWNLDTSQNIERILITNAFDMPVLDSRDSARGGFWVAFPGRPIRLIVNLYVNEDGVSVSDNRQSKSEVRTMVSDGGIMLESKSRLIDMPTVFDSMGRIMWQSNERSTRIHIPRGGFGRGLFFVQYTMNGEKSVEKVLLVD